MHRPLWKLSEEKYEFIKGEIVHLFKLYNVHCIPVSGFELAVKMGITLVAYSSLKEIKLEKALTASEDGFYLESDGREYIFYNNIGKSYERQNMTILHEIGHCVLDHTGYSEQEEWEASFFAKFAIAPPVLVEKIGATSPMDIYNRFDITYEAAWYAYEYYLKWKRNHELTGCFTSYEQELIDLYGQNA